MRRWGAALLVLGLAGVPAAASMSGGIFSISKTSQDEGGQPASTGGSYAVSSSLGQAGGVGNASGGSMEALAGFYGGTSALPPSLSLFGVTTQTTRPLIGGLYLGVPIASSTTFSFSEPMIASTLTQALTATLVRDRFGRTVNQAVPLSVAYSSVSNQAVVLPAGGSWDSGAEFSLSLSTLALDFEGLPIPSAAVRRFVTLADPTQVNVLAAPGDPQTQVAIASNTFSTAFYLAFSVDPLSSPVRASPSAITEADAKARGPVVLRREVTPFDSQDNALATSFAGGQATLTVPYSDTGDTGFVDGFGDEARAKKLSLYVLDENAGLWEKLPASSVDLVNHTVTATMPHMSVYAAIASQDFSVTDAYAFPVPFRPHGPNAGTGAGQTGTDAAGITFINLPEQGTVSVFNVRGERVWSSDIGGLTGKLVWDTRTSAGALAGSGVYLYVIKSPTDRKLGKLAIIR